MKKHRGDGFNVVVTVDDSSKRDSLGEETQPSSFTTYQGIKGKIKIIQCVRIICGITILCAIILFTLIIYLFGDELGDEQNSLSAGVRFHHHHKTLDEQCNGTTYGCCEVYNLCELHDDSNLTYTRERIWPSGRIKNNKGGTNCPRMNEIVHEYNLHYYPSENVDNFNCMNSTYGCCSIDISCDVFVYVMVDISHNKNYSYYSSSTPIERYINHAKENEMGTNCHSFNNIVLAYNNGFYDPINDLLLLFGLILILFIMAKCIRSEDKSRKRYGPDRK